ncbi:hypothetical protein PsorP6_007967 [Peronosclerospora sorghi]|uniref:Uncharacterized protein n=1 Tax=Peronosclerospora sorghi TaxID=230839 RepID=A0ACC0W9X7_9STRA|nr:hypothetical protein PsorP6_007967 [Peronosclerospora sorghi]
MPSNRACPDALTRLNASCTCLTSLAATASSWTFTVTSKPKTVVHGHNKSLMPPPPASRSTPSILAIDSIRPLSVPPTLTTLVLQSFDATPAPITFLPENSTDFETTALPLVLGSPHLLTTLSISTLNLNAIAATTTNFVPESVTTLTLRHCNLSTLRPAFTRSWRRVQVLDVSLNTLTTDFVVAAGALEHVNLSYNALTHFPTRLVQATPGLQALYLQGNALHDLNVSATAFQRIQALETLELDPRTPSSSSRTCPDGTWQRAHGASFCVLSASTANGPSTRSTSPEEAPQRLVAWLLVTALVVLALFLLVLWRRHRAARALAPERAASPSSSFVASTTPNYYAQSTSGYEVEAAAARPETTTLDRVDDDDAWTLHDLARHPVLTSCRLDVDDVHRGQCISRGGFGLVCIGHYRGRAVAVKTMRPAAPDVARDHVRQFVREIALMAQLAHPRIVEFLGACWTAPDDLACVTEFMERGDLRQVTQRWKRRGDVLTWTQHKASIALQIAQALVYLHGLAPCVIHRDLKAKNVMLNANMDAKVSDFGIARSRYGDGRDDHMTGGVGTSFWIAPEVLVGHEYDERADIYSYGVVLAELDTEDYPYWNAAHPAQGRTEEHAILRRVARGTQRPTFASTCPPAILELAAQCLQTEPADRPSALDIVHYLERVLPATTPVSLAPRRHDGRPLASQTIQELVSPSASIFDAASAPRATKGRAGAAGRDETVETTSDGPRTRTDGLSRI